MMANNEEEIFYSDDDLSDSELYQVCAQIFMTRLVCVYLILKIVDSGIQSGLQIFSWEDGQHIQQQAVAQQRRTFHFAGHRRLQHDL